MSKESNDQLSELLDSFQNDNTMEKKIDDFARKKERRSRLQKAKEEPEERILHLQEEIEEPEKEIEIKEEVIESPSKPIGGGTMVFNKGKIEEDMNSGAHTVVMDNHEIQTLIDENKGPKLIHESEEEPKLKSTSKKKNTNNKMIAMVIAGIVGVLLIGGLVFGIVRLVSDSINSAREQTSQEQEASFNQIREFIEGMGEDPQGLTAYESAYKKLSAEQKSQIDELLKNKTGKTFSELIQQIKSQKEEDSKNNNTEIAEQKAKLKDQISSLRAQLQEAQNELDRANTQYNQAQGALNAAISNRDSAQTDLQNAQNRYDQSMNQNQSKIDAIQANIDALTTEKQDLYSSYADQEITDIPDAVRQRINEIDSQIRDYTAQLNSLSNTGDPSLASQVQSAQAAYDNANAQVQSAQNDVSTYQNQVTAAQSKVDEINGQIAQLQSDLNALK